MYDRILRRMRECVRTGAFVMTLHADEEMSNDGFGVYDVERGILTGSIVDRQRDADTAEWKYVIHGSTLGEGRLGLVAKIGPTGKLVIITVYAV